MFEGPLQTNLSSSIPATDIRAPPSRVDAAALEMCVAAQNRQKNPLKTIFWCSKSSKVIDLGGNQKPVYDFLLMINSNLGLTRTVIEIKRLIG